MRRQRQSTACGQGCLVWSGRWVPHRSQPQSYTQRLIFESERRGSVPDIGHTGDVRSRLSFFFCFAAVALLFGACSSTTVVARDDRSGVPPATDSTADSSTTDNASDSESSVGTEDASETADTPADADESSDDDTDDDDRGARDEDDGNELSTPRELEEAEGFGLGGAEQLAGLQADCESGNDMACDILFELSGFDSAEEAVALSCGGRSDTPAIFCTEGVSSIADELVFDLESEGLADIVELCEDDADFTACDFLYFRSPFESEFEEIGATCGGRVQVAVPDCRTFLADS